MKKMKAPEGLGLENYKFTELPLNKIFNTKDRLKMIQELNSGEFKIIHPVLPPFFKFLLRWIAEDQIIDELKSSLVYFGMKSLRIA